MVSKLIENKQDILPTAPFLFLNLVNTMFHNSAGLISDEALSSPAFFSRMKHTITL